MKVYSSGNLWGHRPRERAGRLAAQGEFFWNGGPWRAYAYACAKGLVVDLCQAVQPGRVRAFYAAWLPLDDRLDRLPEQRMRAEAENPLNFLFTPAVQINGRPAAGGGGCSVCWLPRGIENGASQEEAEELVRAYGLDAAQAWKLSRWRFDWPFARRPALRSLSLHLQPDPVQTPCGARFSCTPGCAPFAVPFTHPATGQRCTLQVLACRPQILNAGNLAADGFEQPRHFLLLEYTLEPPLPQPLRPQLRDCLPGDPPRPAAGGCPKTCCAGTVGVFLCRNPDPQGGPQVLAAVSALHFEPPEKADWYLTAPVTPCGPCEVELL